MNASTKTWTIKYNGGAVRLEQGEVDGRAHYRIVEVINKQDVVTHLEAAGRSWKKVQDRLWAEARRRADAAWLATH